MVKTEDVEKFLQKVEESWYLPRGLCLSLIAGTAGFQAFFSAIRSSVEVFDLFKVHPTALPLIHLGGHALIVLLMLGFWLLSRRLPRFSRNEVVILFAPYGHDEVKERINDLKARLKSELSRLVNRRVRLVSLKPHIVIDDQETAHAIRDKTDCYLIIWGYLSRVHRKKREVVDEFPIIYFTYKHPKMTPTPTMNLYKTVAQGLAGRKWIMRRDEEYRDVPVVVSNMKETALFIIGITLSLYRDFDQSLLIFEQLKIDLAGSVKKRQDKWRLIFRSDVEKWLQDVCLETSKAIYYDRIFLPDRLNLDVKILKNCLARTQRALNMKLNWPAAHLNVACLYFLIGDIPKARHHVSEAKTYSPDSSAAWLSNAFLDLNEGKYESGLKEYEVALQKTSTPQLLSEVIVFIAHYFDSNPDKIQMRIALGILCHAFGNDLAAKREFEDFLKESEGRSDMEVLRTEAKRCLEQPVEIAEVVVE